MLIKNGITFMVLLDNVCSDKNLDNFLTNVQALSRFCPIFVQVLSTSNMDKYWTNFQENTWNHEHAFILDKSWTKIGHGQNIDKI